MDYHLIYSMRSLLNNNTNDAVNELEKLPPGFSRAYKVDNERNVMGQ